MIIQRNRSLLNGVFTLMRGASLLLMVLASASSAASTAQYLPSIEQRWQASDLVCIGRATSPLRTGEWRRIDGTDRDQLSTDVRIESCLKGNPPSTQDVRVIGYDVVAWKDVSGSGYGYAGPPTGFVSQGRNLLFLRRSHVADQFEVTVPIYETAIHLADRGVELISGQEPLSARSIITQELEAAAIQFDETDLSYFGYLLDYLGTREGIAELSRFSQVAPLAVRRDAAVAIMFRGDAGAEPAVIALMLDASAPDWKRANAASALADHGTAAALEPLTQLAAQSAPGNERGSSLYLFAASSLERLKRRLRLEQSR